MKPTQFSGTTAWAAPCSLAATIPEAAAVIAASGLNTIRWADCCGNRILQRSMRVGSQRATMQPDGFSVSRRYMTGKGVRRKSTIRTELTKKQVTAAAAARAEKL